MKLKVTQKEMKEGWGKDLVYVPNGTMQIFKDAISPFAYSTRVEGWACDYYDCGDFCVNEGYAPVGKQVLLYEELQPYREAYDKLFSDYSISREAKATKVRAMFEDFKGDCRKRLKI